MKCTVCASSNVKRAFQHSGYQLFRCNECGHLWADGRSPGGAAYDAAYYNSTADPDAEATGYSDYLGTLDRRVKGFRDRVDQIEAFLGRRGRLLDYGCAVGACVKAAKDAGWDAIGYERSEWAAAYGHKTLDVEIVDGESFDESFRASEPFDVVTLWDVIEHVDGPREVLDSIARVLRPGGVIAVNTVNASSVGARLAGREWRHLAPPFHLQYFTRASLQRLIVQAGFEIARVSMNGVMFTSAKRSGKVPLPLSCIDSVMTHWRMRPVAKALNLLDEIEIIAVLPQNGPRRGADRAK